MRNASHAVLVSIINWNNNAATNDCLASIARIDRAKQPDVMLVDNGSREQPLNVSKHVTAKLRSLRIHRNDYNAGFGAAHNLSIAFGIDNRYDYVILLNNDTLLLDTTLFDTLCSTLVSNPAAVAAAPTVLSSTDPPTIWYGGGSLSVTAATTHHLRLNDTYVQPDEPPTAIPTDFITGCCVAIKLSKITKPADYLPENYFVYWEDAEWCSRMRNKGHTLLYVPGAQLLHHTSSSLGFRSSHYIYYNIRNNLLFIARNTPVGYRTSARLRVVWVSSKYVIRMVFSRPLQLHKLRFVARAWIDGLRRKGGPIG